MTIRFTLDYNTRWGENLVLRKGRKAFPMHYVDGGRWEVEIDSETFFEGAGSVEYFYELTENGDSIRHEWRLHTLEAKDGRTLVEDAWSDIPGWRGAGTAVPVFALRSANDFGVGEFEDLKMMVSWAAKTGQTIIQLLPINDTTMTGTWQDSYPYNANSTFALHPMYVHLPAVGVSMDEEYCRLRDELNALPQIDYEAVNAAKLRYLRQAFATTGAGIARRKAYKTFMAENRHWLMPYAAFCALRDENGTAEFDKWGEYAKYDAAKVEKYCASHKSEIAFHCFVQYHLHMQLTEVRNFAHSKGVVLKGDLPIGISRTSVDAWQYPHLFNMDSQAGAPPDAFSADGQNWGFPTYNWDEMEKDGYAWWKARLGKMSEYFDAFRIDHILGFFRIWEIPVPQKSGLDGYFSPAMPYSWDELNNRGFGGELSLFVEDPRKKGYWHPRINARSLEAYARLDGWRRGAFDALYDDFFYRRHNDFWAGNAFKKLSNLLGSTSMLTCGEDLGMIPACVPGVMSKLNILSLEIQSMSKDPSQEFANPSRYPYACVCTTSTHDMLNLRAWWEEDRERTAHFYYGVVCHGDTGAYTIPEGGFPAEVPYFCEPWICRRVLEQHLASPAMLVILPLQDWLGIDGELRYTDPLKERINVPAIPRYYWRYRMHISLENLLGQTAFNDAVSEMISRSGR